MKTKRTRAVFVAKMTPNKTRQKGGKEYYVYRVLIPKRVTARLKLAPGDYLQVKVRRALWYDMLDWSEMPQTWAMLPAWLKKQIEESRSVA